MNERFELILDECLQALREGSADVATCLSRYPDLAAELSPHLELAAQLMDTYDTAPSEAFAAEARERFLVASGQRLVEAYDVDPTPSFFAAARVRFLMAAHQAFGAKREAERAPRRGLPSFGGAYRVLGGAAAALVLMVGLSGYTVAEASNALPGDRLYGVKLQTERVRLALAFTEGAERDVRLDIASERVDEIERLAEKGRIIGPGVIERLQNETEPLAEDLVEGDLSRAQKERVYSITSKSKDVLASAEGQIAPDAQPVLAEVRTLVVETQLRAAEQLVNDEPRPVITPDVVYTPAAPTNTPEPTATPDASATPGGSTATPQPSATPAREGIVVGPTPVGVDIGVTWVRIAVGRFTTLIPSPQDGWSIAGVNPELGTSTTPNLVSITNVDGTQIITLNPRNGDMYWFIAVNNVFDEVRLREARDGQTFVIDRQLLQRLYGPLAEVPLYILDHIEIAPEPTPVPTATPTIPVAPAP